jgi:hypothetical protein
VLNKKKTANWKVHWGEGLPGCWRRKRDKLEERLGRGIEGKGDGKAKGSLVVMLVGNVEGKEKSEVQGPLEGRHVGKVEGKKQESGEFIGRNA